MQDHFTTQVAGHLPDDRLELYALDRLNETDVIAIEEHLMVCEGCRDRLEDVAAFAITMREVLKAHPLPSRDEGWLSRLRSFGERISMPQLGMAGALAAAVLAVGIYLGTGPHNLPPVASLQLNAMRGDLQAVHAARATDLTLRDVPSAGGLFRVELVSDVGVQIWTGQPRSLDGAASVRIEKPLAAGVYFARLYDSAGKLLHEYGFRITE